jgi:hypothetical protein
VALHSLKDLGHLTYRRFLELCRHMVGLLGRVISPSQGGLYLHRTTQHRKTQTNIHALSGIRTHDPSNQPAKTHASDRTATVTGSRHTHPINLSSYPCLGLPSSSGLPIKIFYAFFTTPVRAIFPSSLIFFNGIKIQNNYQLHGRLM